MNHFPGNGFLVNKHTLGECLQHRRKSQPDVFTFSPRAFTLPFQRDEFEEAWKTTAHQSDHFSWLYKSPNHRGVEAIAHFEQTKSINYTLTVQEHIRSHLIEGFKFDLGLYAVITSVEPLRVFLFDDILVRVCKHPYPAGAQEVLDDPESWIIVDYQNLWGMSIMQKYTHAKNNLEAMKMYFADANYTAGPKVFPRIFDIMRTTILSSLLPIQERVAINLIRRGQVRRESGPFFEMVRFDFLVDPDFNPKLMEVNMSPNLVGKNPRDGQMKQLLVDSLFNLVGLNETANRLALESVQKHSPITDEKSAAACKAVLSQSEDCVFDCPIECLGCQTCLGVENRESFSGLQQERSRDLVSGAHFGLLFPTTTFSKWEALRNSLDRCPLPTAVVLPPPPAKKARSSAGGWGNSLGIVFFLMLMPVGCWIAYSKYMTNGHEEEDFLLKDGGQEVTRLAEDGELIKGMYSQLQQTGPKARRPVGLTSSNTEK